MNEKITFPSTTTPEHALQSGQHDHLQEHPVHHQPPQGLPVDKQRNQESVWRGSLQSGGNPRTTFSTGYEPKKLATVSRISGIIDPFQSYDVQKEFGERGHQAPITEEVKEFGEIGTAGVPDSKKSETRPTSNRTCTSTIPQKAFQILISKMESYKSCWHHHCMPNKLPGN